MVVLDVVSSIVPQARALSTIKGLATGKPAFVGEASIEAKISDAQTGKLLAAVADRRVGGKKLEAELFDSWGDVNEILEYWAKLGRFRLCEARGWGQLCLAGGLSSAGVSLRIAQNFSLRFVLLPDYFPTTIHARVSRKVRTAVPHTNAGLAIDRDDNEADWPNIGMRLRHHASDQFPRSSLSPHAADPLQPLTSSRSSNP